MKVKVTPNRSFPIEVIRSQIRELTSCSLFCAMKFLGKDEYREIEVLDLEEKFLSEVRYPALVFKVENAQ